MQEIEKYQIIYSSNEYGDYGKSNHGKVVG
jgi:hypothetical protein